MRAVKCTDPEAGRNLSRCCRSEAGQSCSVVSLLAMAGSKVLPCPIWKVAQPLSRVQICSCLLVVVSKADLKKLLIKVALVLLGLTWGKENLMQTLQPRAKTEIILTKGQNCD